MNLKESKLLAWGAMFLMVVVIIISVVLRAVTEIWEFSVLFLAFMAVFCHLAALLLAGMSKAASRKLDYAAIVFGVLAILALIVIFIINFCLYY